MAVWGIRGAIVGVWFAAIYLFLISPQLVDLLFSRRSINILAWPATFGLEHVAAFEKERGIKVHVTYIENNEELFVKMHVGGAKGYDLIVGSDYIIPMLIREKLLKPLDKDKLPFFVTLQEPLLNHYYDQGNRYTIPYVWHLYGIAINTDYFKAGIPPARWDIIFQPAVGLRVSMLDDARESASIGALYLFGSPHLRTKDEWEAVQKLYVRQKPHVAMYTDLRADYLLVSGACAAAVTNSVDISKLLQTHKNIQFIYPEEGTFWVIDSFALTNTTQKDEVVYEFLNYLYSQDTMGQLAATFNFCPPIHMPVESDNLLCSYLHNDNFLAKLSFFNGDFDERNLNNFWIAVKS